MSIKIAGMIVKRNTFLFCNNQQLTTNKAKHPTNWFAAPNTGQILLHLPERAKAPPKITIIKVER
jgi:hypothetical protein